MNKFVIVVFLLLILVGCNRLGINDCPEILTNKSIYFPIYIATCIDDTTDKIYEGDIRTIEFASRGSFYKISFDRLDTIPNSNLFSCDVFLDKSVVWELEVYQHPDYKYSKFISATPYRNE